MKKIIAFTLGIFLIAGKLYSQNEMASIAPRATAVIETPGTQQSGKPVVITLKNAAEKSVPVFAGPKEEIKDPKITVVGGLSLNKLYLKENDAVCLMTIDKRPIACTVIKPGMTFVEVNTSANSISSK